MPDNPIAFLCRIIPRALCLVTAISKTYRGDRVRGRAGCSHYQTRARTRSKDTGWRCIPAALNTIIGEWPPVRTRVRLVRVPQRRLTGVPFLRQLSRPPTRSANVSDRLSRWPCVGWSLVSFGHAQNVRQRQRVGLPALYIQRLLPTAEKRALQIGTCDMEAIGPERSSLSPIRTVHLQMKGGAENVRDVQHNL